MQRRERVADLYLQGTTQTAIAEQLGYAQSTICGDLKEIRKTWRESAIRDFDLAREIELQKLDRIEREAWAAWERSQKPLQSARFKEGGSPERGEKTVKNQYGDPRFLDQVLKCCASRRALLGLDEQTAVVQNNVAIQLSVSEREQHIAAIVAEAQQRALAAPDSGSVEVTDVDEGAA
jgi:ParB-like chromosome segregation protein Spo0J